MHEPSVNRVAAAWILEEEARRVASIELPRQARRDRIAAAVRAELTPDVLAAFASGSLDRVASDLRFATSVGQRLETLWRAFQTAPQAWADFKRMLGIKADSLVSVMRELPGKIRAFMAAGKKYLEHLGERLVDAVPALRIYLDARDKLPSLGQWLEQMVNKMPPNIQRALRAVTTRFTSLAAWLDNIFQKNPSLKVLGVVASASVYAFIWFNVDEISWDLPELIRGFTGGYTFVDLFQSLPESAVGFVLKLMFPGLPSGLMWNALLPITVALRIAWLHRQRLLTWSQGHATILWDRMSMTSDPYA